MKISVITITCRENPRFEEMGLALSASLARADGVELEWVIVDERSRKPSSSPAGIKVSVVAPLPSQFRSGQDKAPAHNSSRNAGLFAAKGEYIVFLNDCSIVTKDWVHLVADCAKQGVGVRSRVFCVPDLAVPASGEVTYRDHHDRLRPVPATTVAGACWGAPARAFGEIHGFDLAYDGQDKGHDLDAIVRLSRTGLGFVSSERAFAIRLLRTKTKTEISTRKEVFNGADNQKRLNDLQRTRDRILPVVEAREPRPAKEKPAARVVAIDVPAPVPSPPGAGNNAAATATTPAAPVIKAAPELD